MSTPLARLATKTLVPTGEGFGGFIRLVTSTCHLSRNDSHLVGFLTDYEVRA